jgi:hypothetical protein
MFDGHREGGTDNGKMELRSAAGLQGRLAGGLCLSIPGLDVAAAGDREPCLGWLGIPGLALLPCSVGAPVVERGLAAPESL